MEDTKLKPTITFDNSPKEKCRDCGLDKVCIFSHTTKAGMSRYINENGYIWVSGRCPECHKKRYNTIKYFEPAQCVAAVKPSTSLYDTEDDVALYFANQKNRKVRHCRTCKRQLSVSRYFNCSYCVDISTQNTDVEDCYHFHESALKGRSGKTRIKIEGDGIAYGQGKSGQGKSGGEVTSPAPNEPGLLRPPSPPKRRGYQLQRRCDSDPYATRPSEATWSGTTDRSKVP